MPDLTSHSVLKHLALFALIALLGPIQANQSAELPQRMSFQTIPGALPVLLDEDRVADAEGSLSQMSEQALQAALRARREHFEASGFSREALSSLDPTPKPSSPPADEPLPDPGLAAYLHRAGLTTIGGTNDEPTGAVALPVDSSQSCPGFYVLRTHPGVNSRAGRVGAEILLGGTGLRTLQGGLNFGGQATSSIRGFAAFSIANANTENQVVNIGLNAGAAGRLVLERRSGGQTTIILDQVVSAGETDVSAVVPPGFYVVGYEPNSSTPTNYTVSALTSYPDRAGGGFQGGVVFGGYHDPNRASTGFGGFCIAQAFEVTVNVLSQPTYGSSGARGLAFSVSSGDGQVFLDSRPAEGDDRVFQDCPDCPKMVRIAAGSFIQGSPASEPGSEDAERPQRQVNVPAFAMGQTPVTFAQWDACVADGGCTHNPGDEGWGRGNRPVINVNWHDAQEYVTWLSTKTGEDYRLPSESEWEYAARAGTISRFNTGDCITTDQANFDGRYPAQGCPPGAYRAQTLPVASFVPNDFGLYDTHGNVDEWVQDCLNDDYVGAPTDGSAWETCVGTAPIDYSSYAIVRGGTWIDEGEWLRSAARDAVRKNVRDFDIGFRVARSETASTTPAYVLSVTSEDASSVSIQASPSTYAGTTNYQKSAIPSGTRIELTAPSSAGSAQFDRWGGCDSVSGRTCIFTVEQDRTVTVVYAAAGPSPGQTFTDCPDCPTMVMIPAGSFVQGSPPDEPQRNSNEGPQRTVNVPAFAMGQTTVTFDQWDACVADNGCNSDRAHDQGWGRGNRPVVNVNWNDAQEYVIWLSNKTGHVYRLPSESEWEYAARAGTTGRFNTGDCITTNQANFRGDFPPRDCPSGIFREQTVSVGFFAPNAFGLYESHGNVAEWVQDCWNEDYVGAPTGGIAWMSGDCSRAVRRGGSWGSDGFRLRSAYRAWFSRVGHSSGSGFRVARSVDL